MGMLFLSVHPGVFCMSKQHKHTTVHRLIRNSWSHCKLLHPVMSDGTFDGSTEVLIHRGSCRCSVCCALVGNIFILIFAFVLGFVT